MLTLNTKIERLASVGPTLKKTLNKLGIFYILDLFYHFPFRYIDFSQKVPITKVAVGQLVTLEGRIIEIKARRSFRSRLAFTEATLEDDTGKIRLIWFNQPYIAKQLTSGSRIVVAGKVEFYRQNQLTNPYFEILNDDAIVSGKILPVYPLTSGITNLRLAKLIKIAWESTEKKFTDLLSHEILSKFKILPISQAITTLHFPKNTQAVNLARLRIAIDDVLPQQLAAQIKQKQLENSLAPKIITDLTYIKQQLARLPFELTKSQKRATWDILQDLETGKPMNRLLQGDVGSGKTIVSVLAALMTAKSNYQTILLAPTEILAQQHYVTFRNFATDLDSTIGLLTKSFSTIQGQQMPKARLLSQVADNTIKILIGTHAVLSESIKLGKLGLIIIDEQHRFGVGQRAFLSKTHQQDLVPHFLSMSATPIPRTLALSLFGNLKISQLKSMPQNRLPIKTKLCTESDRKSVYQHILSEITNGKQVFIITPKVEENQSETKSVKVEFEKLKKLFPHFRIGLIYGGLKSSEKEQVMKDFAAQQFDILVATTVIEIGIDIPNASVILIEGAENFGLAQLHQLRGRVGRGKHPSFCYLFTTNDNHTESERLKIFASISDGFILAEHDLEQRGFGDLFGENQSGFNFKFPKFITIKALKTAHQIAQEILNSDPNLVKHPTLKSLANNYLETIHTE
jgi:ATP-dependent DNA helicase RecG